MPGASFLRLLALSAVLLASLAAAPARAGEAAPAEPAAAPDADPAQAPAKTEVNPSDLGAGARTVVLPSESTDSISEHWQRRAEDLAARDLKRAAEEEREIERIQQALSLENLFAVATALVREAHQELARGNASEALARCETAVRLAPRFGPGHLCVARATLKKSPAALFPALRALFLGISATLGDVRSRRIALADEALTLLFGLIIAGAALILLVILRYGGLFFHDFHHLFPRGVSPWQTAIIALVLVSLPLLFGLGVVGSMAVALAAVSVFLARGEAIAVSTAFLVLATSQFGMTEVVRSGAFGQVAHDVYLLEHGDAPVAAAARLKARVDAGLGDYSTSFALGRYDKRLGRLAEAEAAYGLAAKASRTADVLNNLGNVKFIARDEEGAAKLYREANNLNPSLAEPSYNLSTFYFRHSKLEEGNQARKAALEAGGEAIRQRVQVQDDFRANIYLIDVSLPDAAIEALAEGASEQVVSVGGSAWRLMAGRVGGLWSAALAVLAALLTVVGQLVQHRVRPSSKCEKCGRAVCPRCDPELGSTTGMCGQCISVFVRRSGVDAPDRIRKEIEVRRFRKRQRLTVRLAGLVVGGGGHVLAGRIGGGVLFIVVFSLVLAEVLFWDGFLRVPFALDLSVSGVRVGLYVGAFLLLYAVSVRHLLKHEEAD